MQPFGQNRHEPKIGGGALPPFWERLAGSPCNTISLGSWPTCVPSGILIHRVIWPQQIWAEKWGLCPFGGWGSGSPSNTMWPGPSTMVAKSHLDPSNRLATIHQRYIQDRTDRQPSDSIGRIVLQRADRFTNGRPICLQGLPKCKKIYTNAHKNTHRK